MEKKDKKINKINLNNILKDKKDNKLYKYKKYIIHSNLLVLTFITIFMLFVVIPENIFAQNDVNSYEYLKIDIEQNINFDINKESKFKVNNFELISYFFPQKIEESQYINNFETNINNYQILNDSGTLYLKYIYQTNDLKKQNNIKNVFTIESIKHNPKITTKVKYPVKSILQENQKYLSFTNLINIDEDVKNQASELAEGLDDVYIIASKIAKWIQQDINYDLESVTLLPNQTSTAVFDSKSGVCKEITNLYISMMRSLGIPARVVTGYAYTDSEELVSFLGDNWGGHAWAEVLIDNKWVPFDLTYNQYGFVDATHLVLDKSIEVQERNVLINSSGYGYQLENLEVIKPKFTILEKKHKVSDSYYDITISGPQEIGFGSYGYLKINIHNNDNFYKILFLKLAKVDDIELLDVDNKMIIFQPDEEKVVYFRYRIPDLKDGFIYTFPFTIYNNELQKDFNITVKEEFLKIKKIALPVYDENTEGSLSNNNLLFDCNLTIGTPNSANCFALNPNNFEINNVKACLKSDCKTFDLKLNEKKDIQFDTNNYTAKVDFEWLNKSDYINFNIEYPELSFTHKLESNILTIDYQIDKFKEGLSTDIYVNDILKNSSKLETSTLKIYLDTGNNSVLIKLNHNNHTFSTQTLKVEIIEQDITTETMNFIQKLIEWFLGLFK